MSSRRFFFKKWSLFFLFFLLAGSFFLISLPNDHQTANSQSPQKKILPTFTIGSPVTDPIHELVVRNAFSLLTNYHLNHPDNGMTEECIDAIVQGSRAPDNPAYPLAPWEDLYHWTITGCTAQEVWQRSTQQLEWIYYEIMNDCFLRAPELINYTLGVAFHVVADFFAHSSWCDRSGRYISGLDFESPSIYDEWTTYKLSPNVIKPKDKPGDQYFYEAYAAAVEMTSKEYHRFEKRLFNKYPSSMVCENLDKAGVKKTVALDWPEGGPMRILFPGTLKITWDHCGINPNSNVKISLCKDTVPIGDIAEIPLDNREYDWEVGKYYYLNNGEKEWHTAPLGEYTFKITFLETPEINSSTTVFRTWGFRFTSPAGEPLNRGESKNITWETDAFHGHDGRLYIYRNGNYIGRIADISAAQQAGGSFTWIVGEYIGGTAEIGDGYQFQFEIDSPDTVYPQTLSNTFSIKLPPVTSLTASPGNGSIRLDWMNPGDSMAKNVMIRYNTTTFPSNPDDGILLGNKSITPMANDGWTHSGLINGTTYYYTVFVHDGIHYSVGAKASATPNIGGVANPPLTSFTASPGNGQIQLSWQNPSGLSGVLIRCGTAGFDGAVSEEFHLGSSQNSYVHTGLNNETTYYYTALAEYGGGLSTGVQASAKPTLMSDRVPPVTSFAASPGNGSVKLDWTNPGDPVVKNVMVRFSPSSFPANPTDGSFLIDKSVTPGANDTWTHDGLTNGATVYYSIFAYDSQLNYSFGVQASARPVQNVFWRYYGSDSDQGKNLVWYVGYGGTGPASTNLSVTKTGPASKPEFIDLLKGKKPEKYYGDPREAAGTREMERGELKTLKAGQNVVLMRNPGEAGKKGKTRIQTLSYIGCDYLPTVSNTNWEINGIGDFNGDSKPDILWRYYGADAEVGTTLVWYMDGKNLIGCDYLPKVANADWKIDGIADFNGDSKPDVLWRYYGADESVGTTLVWYMDGKTNIGCDYLPKVANADWKIEGIADFNGDSKPDILWRYYGADADLGKNLVWYMDGKNPIGCDYLPAVANVNWRIQNN